MGVPALQGAFDVHAKRLTELGASAHPIRKPEELASLDALVLPGGESTTFLKHLERAGFYSDLDAFVRTKPVFGTCAGCILLAEPTFPGGPMEMVFIRAPRISRTGPGVEVLAHRDGDPVLVRSGRML